MIIPISRTCAAEELTVRDHLAFVDDFFAAVIAVDADACAADDLLDGDAQADGLKIQEFVIGHGLVGLQLGEIVAGFGWGVGQGSLAKIQFWGNAKRLFRFNVYECCSDFSVVFDAQGAMSN